MGTQYISSFYRRPLDECGAGLAARWGGGHYLYTLSNNINTIYTISTISTHHLHNIYILQTPPRRVWSRTGCMLGRGTPPPSAAGSSPIRRPRLDLIRAS